MLAWLDGARIEALPADPSGGRPGCFETMRVTGGGGIPWIADHRARLEASCSALLPDLVPLLDPAFEACLDLAAMQSALTGRLRLTVWMDGELPHVAVRLEASIPERGPWRVGTIPGHPGPAAGAHKQTERGPWDRALAAARGRGLDEMIMVDEAGWVVEGSRTSVFLGMPDGSVWTPPLELGALPGVARARVVTLLRQHGRDVQVRSFPVEALQEAHEVICTNAWLGAVPVAALEDGPSFATNLGCWLAGQLFS